MDTIKIIGLVAGAFTAASLLPQLITTLKKKKAGDVSMIMFFVMLTGNTLWAIYGFKKTDLPIILTNLFSIATNIAMIILKIKYGKGEPEDQG